MDFTNNTPIPAKVRLGQVDEAAPVFCQITAKATFCFDCSGNATLDTQTPYPIFDKDEETELGILPSDELPHPRDSFSVIAQACAYNEKPAPARRVSLQVGAVRRELLVTGDREWSSDKTMSSPAPFVRMPITYERAFGGTVNVMLDKTTVLPVSWPQNPKGRGFDPTPELKGFAEAVYCAPGYPCLQEGYVRRPPNIEKENEQIKSPQDTPSPAGWGALPVGSPVHMIPWIKRLSDEVTGPSVLKTMADDITGKSAFMGGAPQEALFRCHPDWITTPPEPRAEVTMTGLVPEGFARFNLPDLAVDADYLLGNFSGTRRLTPFMLVLLPEEKRFYLVYRYSFEFVRTDGEESLRLRLEL